MLHSGFYEIIHAVQSCKKEKEKELDGYLVLWAQSVTRDYIRAEAENEQNVNNIITSVAFYESMKLNTEVDFIEYVLWKQLNCWRRDSSFSRVC